MNLTELLKRLRLEYTQLLRANRHGDKSLTPLLCEIWDLNPAMKNFHATHENSDCFIRYHPSNESQDLSVLRFGLLIFLVA